MDFSIKNGDFHSYVSLPEGNIHVKNIAWGMFFVENPICKTRLSPCFRRSMVWMRNYTAQWMSCTAICEILLEYQLLAITYPPQVPIASIIMSTIVYMYTVYIYILLYTIFFESGQFSIEFDPMWPHPDSLLLPPRLVLYLPSYEGPGAAETWVPRVPRGEEIHPGTAGDGHYNSAKISILPGCLGRGCLLENPRTQWRF